jgi:hypothetical protein
MRSDWSLVVLISTMACEGVNDGQAGAQQTAPALSRTFFFVL